MNRETLEALKGSIAKWEAIERGDGDELGASNCPLCKMFFKNDCRGCPVSEAAGAYCFGTPFNAFNQAMMESPDGESRNITRIDEAPLDEAPRLKRLARDELEFLRSLLPAGEATQRKPRSWRVCPACRGRATKIFHLTLPLIECQQCGHRYDVPPRPPA